MPPIAVPNRRLQLPSPPRTYDQRDQAELRRAISSALASTQVNNAREAGTFLLADYIVVGALGVPATSVAPALTAAIADAAEVNGRIVVSAYDYALSANVTVPANVTLVLRAGGRLLPDTAKTLTINGGLEAGPYQIFDGNGDVRGNPICDGLRPEWFYNEVTAGDWMPAIKKAADLGGTPTNTTDGPSNGRKILFQHREYYCDTVWDLFNHNNVYLVGQGQQHVQGFRQSGTVLIYTGAGSTPFLKLNANFARGFHAWDMAFKYNNDSFTGDLIECACPGIRFDNCFFGGAGLTSVSPETKFNARSCLYFSANIESAVFDHCMFQGAQWFVIIANNPGSIAGPISFPNCWFTDASAGYVDMFGLITCPVWFHNATFNPHYGAPPLGVRLRTLNFDLSGCYVRGDLLSTPTPGPYIDVQGGGSIKSCYIATYGTAIHVENCEVDISDNTIQAKRPLEIVEGETIVRGGGNKMKGLNGPAAAVYIAEAYSGVGHITMDFGPNEFDGTFTYSYAIGRPADASNFKNISGEIRYSFNDDVSIGGPLMNCLVELKTMVPDTYNSVIPLTIQPRQVGFTFSTQTATGPVTFTLPPARAGLHYTIQKYETHNVTVQVSATGSDKIYAISPGTTGVVTSLTNKMAGDYFAEIELHGHYNPAIGDAVWHIVRQTGTWGQVEEATLAVTPGALAAQTGVTYAVIIATALAGDFALVSYTGAMNGAVLWQQGCVTNGQIDVTMFNGTAAAVTPGAGTLRARRLPKNA